MNQSCRTHPFRSLFFPARFEACTAVALCLKLHRKQWTRGSASPSQAQSRMSHCQMADEPHLRQQSHHHGHCSHTHYTSIGSRNGCPQAALTIEECRLILVARPVSGKGCRLHGMVCMRSHFEPIDAYDSNVSRLKIHRHQFLLEKPIPRSIPLLFLPSSLFDYSSVVQSSWSVSTVVGISPRQTSNSALLAPSTTSPCFPPQNITNNNIIAHETLLVPANPSLLIEGSLTS